MKERKKRKKLWMVLVLAISLITVQTMQTRAEASDGEARDAHYVCVENLSEFQAAVEQAEDGDIIGLGAVITIDSFIERLGTEDKHIKVVRMNLNSGFEIVQGGNVGMYNMDFDGRDIFTATCPMFCVYGSLRLEQSTVQNCSYTSKGGAVYVTRNGGLTTNGVIFNGNSAGQGGHIYNEGVVNLNNTWLGNGVAAADGGAIKSCEQAVLMLTNCVLRGNSAALYGGAVSNSGNMIMSHSIAFGNSAEFGADIANDRSATYSDGYEIAELEDLFTAEGVTASGWEFDCADTSSPTVSGFDTDNPDSLKKMNYEAQGTGGSGETGDGGNSGEGNGNDNPGESGDNTGDNDNQGDTGNTTGGNDNQDDNGDTTGGNGNQGDTGNTTGGDDNNSDEGSSGANGGTVSGNDVQGDGAGSGSSTDSGTSGTDGSTNKTDGGGSQSGTSQNNGTSGSTNTTPSVTSREDNSTTTTTNNYYTYEYPSEKDSDAGKKGTTEQSTSASEASGQGTSRQNTSAVAAKETETEETANASENPEASTNTQIPDNISLNLVDVDIVYNMTDGISNIAISNEREKTDAAAVETVSVEALSALPTADTEEDSAINWYEIVKMALLAAILLIVIPKPEPKRRSKKKRKKKAAMKPSKKD